MHEIDANCDVVNRVLVGNKNDNPDRKVVLTEDARRFAEHMGIQLFETSAKENFNVEETFRAITELVLRSKRDRKDEQPGGNIRLKTLKTKPLGKPFKGSCCK